MEKIERLIDTLTIYLQNQSSGMSGIEYFTVYAIPIIQLIIVLGGVGAGIYKYYQVKNREINEKMLSDVYSPLYSYFIKQELFCSLNNFERDIHESPILEMKSKKQTQKFTFGENSNIQTTTEESIVLGLSRENFTNVLKNINIGLAGKELYTLLGMYEVVCHIESGKSFNDAYLNSTILKVKVEQALRKEILEGYNYYHKKLGISRKKEMSFCEIKDSDINFTYTISEQEKNDLRENIKNNPEIYR